MVSILGNPVARREDAALVTGAGSYVDNLDIPGVLHAVYVRSAFAHARITSIDTQAASAAPGVAAVFTAAEVAELGRVPHVVPSFPDEMRRPFLAGVTVRYAGQPVAAVVAETRAQAVDAAELVIVDFEPLPAVVDPEAAAADEVVLFSGHGTNVLSRTASDSRADFSGCETVVRCRIVNQRLTAAPIEARAGAAWWTREGRLVHYSACQGAHPTRDLLTAIYGLAPQQVRVVVPDVGGSFGAKARTYPEELVLAHFARAVGRPVKWTETRSESLQSMPHGRGQIQYAAMGGTREGLITAYQLDAVQDVGAYPLISGVIANLTQRMLTGNYEIRNVGFTALNVVTNTMSTNAYRGAGRPEATVAVERMVDRFAAEIGMDAAEVRFKNLVPRFTEPYISGIGTSYDTGDYPRALQSALDTAGYDMLRAEQQARRADGARRLLGIGIGCYVEVTAGGPSGEHATVALHPDGRLRVTCGATPAGQGHATVWAMIAADATGIPDELIDVTAGDTDEVARGGLTVGSRSVQLGGTAVAAAASQLVERGRTSAAELLEAAVADVVHDARAGAFTVAGSPTARVGWAQIAESLGEAMFESCDFTAPHPTFPSGAHIAAVELDAETGAARLVRMVAVDDAGRIINPLLAAGQIHGGVAQGVAQALLEGIEYDAEGNLLTANFMDYPVISAAELCRFDLVSVCTPTWANDLGAKGIGESGTIGAIPAVYNAVIDALSHLGVKHLETPLTPHRVWQALNARP